MRTTRVGLAAAGVLMLSALRTPPGAQPRHSNSLIDLWMQGKPAFGVMVPRATQGRRGEPPPPGPAYTRDIGERLAANPLYDFAFLNLEGGYDAEAVRVIAEGLRSPQAVSRKTLIVRIPPIERDGAEAARARVREVLALGADGVTLPHIRNVDEARQAIGFFREAGADVWSPSNPAGQKLAMLMLEDPGAVAQAAAIADLGGYSILACGIGSLQGALGGDAAGAEAGAARVLAETRRTKLVNMLTANAGNVEKRIKEGFLALLFSGPGADEAIKIGRAASGR